MLSVDAGPSHALGPPDGVSQSRICCSENTLLVFVWRFQAPSIVATAEKAQQEPHMN